MRVLLTGAFGNIGAETLHELLVAGHRVRAFDLESPKTRKLAARFGSRAEPCWGDITCAEDLARALEGCDAVIHDAAILPPRSEQEPELAHRVNVEGTRQLVKACEARSPRPRLVFASSLSLFGPSAHLQPPRRAEDPVVVTDHYTRAKAECEEMLRASSLDWIILRFAAAPPLEPETRNMDFGTFFRIDPATRVEYLHPADAGLAQARAITCDEALHRVLLVGGGASCQVRIGDLNGAFLDASGIGRLPDSVYGSEPYYTDWMDTEESQRLLRYQRHSFDDFRRQLRKRLAPTHPLVTLLRWPIRLYLMRAAARARRQGAGGQARSRAA